MQINIRQSHAVISCIANNVRWHELTNLSDILNNIKKDSEGIGKLFTDFLKNGGSFVGPVKKIGKTISGDIDDISVSHDIIRQMAINIDWSSIDFEKDNLQERIIRNPAGVGEHFTDFLKNLSS